MQAAAFDTLATAHALKEAGFEDAQATAIVDALRQAVTEGLATKADIAEVRGDMNELRVELKADIATLRAELKADLYRALWMQAAGIIGLTVALVKIL